MQQTNKPQAIFMPRDASKSSNAFAQSRMAIDSREDVEKPSRTARKRASIELQKVGERLLELDADALAALPLPETLREAVQDAKRIASFGARRRQLQFIGKLMRRLEPETVDAVCAAVGAERRSRPT